jgi:thioredoxin 1
MSSVVEVNADDWKEMILEADTLVVVDFWHERCPWCIRLAPIYQEVAKEYEGRVKFASLNVLADHENQHLALHFGVMGTPTIIFFCAGRPVDAAVGFRSKEKLEQLVEDVLKNHKECIRKSTELKIDQ